MLPRRHPSAQILFAVGDDTRTSTNSSSTLSTSMSSHSALMEKLPHTHFLSTTQSVRHHQRRHRSHRPRRPARPPLQLLHRLSHQHLASFQHLRISVSFIQINVITLQIPTTTLLHLPLIHHTRHMVGMTWSLETIHHHKSPLMAHLTQLHIYMGM